MDATTATAIVVACAEGSLPQTAEELLAMAEELGRRADRCGVPKRDLVAAAEKLRAADDAGREEAVAELSRAATAVGQQAATLARACDGFILLVAAIKVVKKDDKVDVQQPTGWTGRFKAWWVGWRERRGMKKDDVEMPLLARDQGSAHQGATGGDLPSSSQSQVVDRMSSMRSIALSGSLALLPYIGSAGLLKKDICDDDCRRLVCNVFSCCWGLVGLGESCSSARSHVLGLYAWISGRLGMLGITIFVILFCHWLLDPTGKFPWWLIGIATALHLIVFLWSLREGDL